MRLDKNIGNSDLVLQIGTFAGMSRISVIPDIKQGPSVERPFEQTGDIVRYEIVTQTVALVGRAVQVAGGGMNRQTDAIADTGRKHFLVLAVGIERQHAGAVGLGSPTGAQRMRAAP